MKTTPTLLLLSCLAVTPVALGSGWSSIVRVQDQEPALPTIEQAQAMMQANDSAGAEAAFAKISAANPNNGQAVFMHAYCLHMNGKLDEAHQRHVDATAFPQFAALGHYNHACVHALKNEKGMAFTAIASAREAGFNNLNQLETDTDMDNLRSDARFAELLLELGGTPTTDPASQPPARQLDFLIGTWTTFADGEEAGTTSFTRAFEGRGLQSSSRNRETGETRSLATFVYDEGRSVWKQIWVGRDGTHAIMEGGFADGQLMLTMVGLNGEPATRGRSVYSNFSATGFELSWQTTEDGGSSWNEATKLRYARQ